MADNKRTLNFGITASLTNQSFNNVFDEFFSLEDLIKPENTQYEKNYITIRLASIIEQFFRKIIEEQINIIKERYQRR